MHTAYQEVTMASRPRYSREFKEQADIMVVDDGMKQIEVAERLALSTKTLADQSSTARSGKKLTERSDLSPEQQDLDQLRRENNMSCMECEILKKAAAYFAKDPL